MENEPLDEAKIRKTMNSITDEIVSLHLSSKEAHESNIIKNILKFANEEREQNNPQVVCIKNLLVLAEERLEQMKDPDALMYRFRMGKPSQAEIDTTNQTIEELKKYLNPLKNDR
tara:strand:- start:199 stop:543 length:345 start_codon:yes stop_codon:yes gene_type:complete